MAKMIMIMTLIKMMNYDDDGGVDVDVDDNYD